MEVSKEDRVIDHLYDHIALAAAHYQDALDHQHKYITHFSPVWNKDKLWERYYYQIFDALEEIWDEKMDRYLETLR